MNEQNMTTIETSVDKARTVLRSAISNFHLDKPDMSDFEKRMIGEQAEEINTMLEIVDDYLFEAEKVLGGAC